MAMARPFYQFKTYYLKSSKAGKETECQYLLNAVSNGIHRVDSACGLMIEPKDLPKAKTIMLSNGCDKTSAERVIKYYKQWYNSLYGK